MEVGDKVTAVSDTAQTFTSVETVQKDNSLVLILPIYAAPKMDHSQTERQTFVESRVLKTIKGYGSSIIPLQPERVRG